MTECKELAGKVIQALTLYEEGEYGPEINIEFTDGSVFNACLRTESLIEAKHTVEEGGEPRILRDYSCPIRTR